MDGNGAVVRVGNSFSICRMPIHENFLRDKKLGGKNHGTGMGPSEGLGPVALMLMTL
jgi:hypothetical protein